MTHLLSLAQLHRTVAVTLMTLTITLTLKEKWVIGLPLLDERLSSRSGRLSLRRMADDISGRLERLTAQMQNQEAEINDISTQLANLTQSVSFTVTFSGRDIGDLVEGEVLKFDRVLYNAGNAYSPRTGLFTAPQNDLYAFSLQVSRHPRDPSSCVEADLVHSILQQTHQTFSSNTPPESRSASPTQRHPVPSDLSNQQQQQQQQQSVPLLPSTHYHHQHQQQQPQQVIFKQQQLTSALLCLHNNSSTCRRVVVRLSRGDTVHARMRSGTMVLGGVFTTLSGLKLSALPPFFPSLLH